MPPRAPVRLPRFSLLAVAAAVAVAAGVAAARPSHSLRARAAASAEPRRHVCETVPLPRHPWALAGLGGTLWVVGRDFPSGAHGSLVPVDVVTKRVGRPVELRFDPWNVAAGYGALWIAKNGGDGRLVRVDPHHPDRPKAIGGGRVALGPFVAAGAGYVWTGNGDERYAAGTSVSRIDPVWARVDGRPVRTASDVEGITVAGGRVWVADHSAAAVTSIQPRALRIASVTRVASPPHFLRAARGALWVSNYHTSEITRVDTRTARVVGGPIKLPLNPYALGANGHSVWAAEAAIGGPSEGRLAHVDPAAKKVTQVLTLGGALVDLAFMNGSLWVAKRDPDALVRVC